MEKITSNAVPLINDLVFDQLLKAEMMVAFEYYQRETHYEPAAWIRLVGSEPRFLNPGDMQHLDKVLYAHALQYKGMPVSVFFMMIPMQAFSRDGEVAHIINFIGSRADDSYNVGITEYDRDEDGRFYLKIDGMYGVNSDRKPTVAGIPFGCFWDGYMGR